MVDKNGTNMKTMKHKFRKVIYTCFDLEEKIGLLWTIKVWKITSDSAIWLSTTICCVCYLVFDNQCFNETGKGVFYLVHHVKNVI